MNTTPHIRLCLIEDDPIMGESLVDHFQLEGFEVRWFRCAEEALAGVVPGSCHVILSDIRLPDLSGEVLFERLRAHNPMLPPVIFITGFGSIERAVALLKLGAADYITKPFDLDALVARVRALSESSLERLPLASTEQCTSLGISPAMLHIAAILPRIAERAGALLITGESGVGKERLARAFHVAAAKQTDEAFVAVNCGALPESLLEAELFGHEKGAFTGATTLRRGLFERAHGGTLFLDEIGDMPLPMQVRLLRVIQERCITRLGGEHEIEVNARIVCATHRDLKSMVEHGTFREDLYYRINVVRLPIPALRERREDILWLARRFLQEIGEIEHRSPRRLHPDAEQALLRHAWPGNVRELKNTIERACIFCTGDELRAIQLFPSEDNIGAWGEQHPDQRLGDYIHEQERHFILHALGSCDWRIAETAERLGISRKNLWEKMQRYALSRPLAKVQT
jgi:DNA-binding NtrC family response regulator